MRSFTFSGIPARVLFGTGTLGRIAEEAERLGIERALVLATPQQEEQARDIALWLGPRAAGSFAGATMHTPVAVTEAAMALVGELEIDGVVAIGGGSTIGLGKAIAYRTDLPQLVVPTTYAGSEMTPILGETRDGRKTTVRDPRILPETVLYDVALTLGLPLSMSVTSGMNAIAHAVEALYAHDRNPIVEELAVQGIGAIAAALPAIAARPRDADARAEALYGAWLCGTCLGASAMSLHHKLCHTLGGLFDLPHAETHTVVLPHVLRFNGVAAPEALARVAGALGAADAPLALHDLATGLGAAPSLAALGMPESGIDAAVDEAMAQPYWNPRPFDAAAIRRIVAAAWSGTPP